MRTGVPLLTYANHASCLDEPLMMSSLLPLSSRVSPSRLRWTVCTEEVCFGSPATAAYFGAGKAIPIQRGGSLYQRGLADLQRRLDAGAWVNIFAEGRIWQEQGAPLRDEDGRWCRCAARAQRGQGRRARARARRWAARAPPPPPPPRRPPAARPAAARRRGSAWARSSGAWAS